MLCFRECLDACTDVVQVNDDLFQSLFGFSFVLNKYKVTVTASKKPGLKDLDAGFSSPLKNLYDVRVWVI